MTAELARRARCAALAITTAAAALGGAVVARGIGLFESETLALAAGAACVTLGMLAGSPGRGYLAGVIFGLSWGLAESGLRLVAARDVLPIALLVGLLALGPVAALGGVWCPVRWSRQSADGTA